MGEGKACICRGS